MTRWFPLLLVAEFVAIALAKWPNQRLFGAFAFGDQGANLAADRLLTDGWSPGVDFNYLYGFLSLLVGRAVFGAFGCTPGVYSLATGVMAVGVVALLGRTAVALKAPLPARVFLVASVPLAVHQLPQLNFAHAIEGLLFAAALYLWATQRLPLALAALTAAVLAKPALGYVFGLVVVVRLAAAPPGEGSWWRRFGLAILPAAVTAATGLALSAAWFGTGPVAESLFPAKARLVYEYEDFGFFAGRGRLFWNPPGANVRFYLGTPAGVWLASSAFLMVTAAVLVVRARRSGTGAPCEGLVVACGAVHLAFILFAFAHNYSWTYYAPVLLTGVVAAASADRRAARLVWVLAAAAAVGNYAEGRGVVEMWRERRSVEACGGLYATPDVAADWGRVRQLARDRRVFVLNYLGGVFAITPDVDSTRAWCFYWWMPTDRELAEAVARCRAADVIVVPKHNLMADFRTHPLNSPALAPELAACPHVVELKTLVLRYRSPPREDER